MFQLPVMVYTLDQTQEQEKELVHGRCFSLKSPGADSPCGSIVARAFLDKVTSTAEGRGSRAWLGLGPDNIVEANLSTHASLNGTDHFFQIGNDRMVVVISNYGYARVRQDEGGAKWLNAYAPFASQFGGSLGYLQYISWNATVAGNKGFILGTWFNGTISSRSDHDANSPNSFVREFGVGYARKSVTKGNFTLNYTLISPTGDDPVIISEVTIVNTGDVAQNVSFTEVWGGAMAHQDLFSSLVAQLDDDAKYAVLSDPIRFTEHNYEPTFEVVNYTCEIDDPEWCNGTRGISQKLVFKAENPYKQPDFFSIEKLFRSRYVNSSWIDSLNSSSWSNDAGIYDLSPPKIFLSALDIPLAAIGCNALSFFGSPDPSPSNPALKLECPPNVVARYPTKSNHNATQMSAINGALSLKVNLTVEAGDSNTFHFLFGYSRDEYDSDTSAANLTKKYSDPMILEEVLGQTQRQWFDEGMRFSVPQDPRIGREVLWNYYYSRSSITYDSYVGEYMLDAGGHNRYTNGYFGAGGFQGPPRSTLQSALPLIFTDPDKVKSIIRHTLRLSHVSNMPDGSAAWPWMNGTDIPYAMFGNGIPVPSKTSPSDQELFLLWLASEYILASKDTSFLSQTYHNVRNSSHHTTILGGLSSAYTHFFKKIGFGQHGLVKMLTGDCYDGFVYIFSPESERNISCKEYNHSVAEAESIYNAGLAAFVLPKWAQIMDMIGQVERADDIREVASTQISSLRQYGWNGHWFRRAWMPSTGWIGDVDIDPSKSCMFLDSQSFGLLSGALNPGSKEFLRLIKNIRQLSLNSTHPHVGAIHYACNSSFPHLWPHVNNSFGISPAINHQLILALAKAGMSQMAWTEWNDNSFIRSSSHYPDYWPGIWTSSEATRSSLLPQLNGTSHFSDFPALSTLRHSWPLYSLVAGILGIDFSHARGVRIKPGIPCSAGEFTFSSKLIELQRISNGSYYGAYSPYNDGKDFVDCEVRVELDSSSALCNGTSVYGMAGEGIAHKVEIHKGNVVAIFKASLCGIRTPLKFSIHSSQ
eukprot:UC4_evm2s647